VIAGAGPSGLALAIELKKIPTITFQIYEKNANVGGTWFENRYPGAACDVASHAYQYSFESKKDWTSQ
jgi:cation diffusion facilitator CzcD-associated flavoprotein CzcO